MKVAIAAVSFALTCGLTLATPSAQGQSGQPAQPGQPSQPPQPGQPAQPGQGTPGQPGQPTQPGRGTPGQPGQPATPAPGTSPGQMGAQGRGQGAAAREITVTGCVMRDTAAPAAGAQGAEAFILTHARLASGAGATSGGDARGQGPSGAAGMGQEYRLMAAGDVKLSAHVNHQVRVTGTVMGGRGRMGRGAEPTGSATPGATGPGSTTPGSATPGASDPGTPSTGAPSAGNMARGAGMAPMLNVTELTMVSATCEMK